MSSARYTPEQIAAAVERYADGESVNSIRRDLGCALDTVRRWVVAEGYALRGIKEAYVASRGRRERVREPPPKGPKPMPASEKAVEVYAAGASIDEAAKVSKLSRKRVVKELAAAGVPVRPRPGPGEGQPQNVDGVPDDGHEPFTRAMQDFASKMSPSCLTLTLELVDDGMGSTRLVARQWLRAGRAPRGWVADRRTLRDEEADAARPRNGVEPLVLHGRAGDFQASWDPEALAEWALGLLHMFAREQGSRQGVPIGR